MRRKILVGVLVLVCVMAIAVPVINAQPFESDNLKKGDLVYRSGAMGFNHAGIYIGNEKVIEVVTKKQLPPYGGAREITLDEFKKAGKYLGAKTVPELDVNKRGKIVEFAKKAVEETKEGKIQYSSMHFIQKGGIGKNGKKLYDCGGFAEAAYESVDIDLVPCDLFLAPKWQMYSSKLKYAELPEGKDLGGIDFSSIQLNYISVFSDQNEEIFSCVLKAQKAKEGDEIIDIEDATGLSLNSFFIGLTLPESEFWVNLNPWEPDRIIDEDLRKTDIGRIMLEADLQMKKDFCKYKNPCESEIGKEYWRLLDEKREELIKECMNNHPDEIKDSRNVLFQVTTRHWIVPDNVEAYETDNEIYIVNATVNIYSEPVYEHSTYEIVNQNAFFVSGACKEDLGEAAKEYGRYAKELEEEMIHTLVVQEVNQGKNYSDLRCVYNSLALAQWYKNKYRYSPSIFTDFTDSKNLTGLESKSDWSAENIWKDYKKSFEEHEYQCWMNETKKETYREDDRIVTETIMRGYSCGGVDFMDIEISDIGDMPSNLRDLTSEAVYSIFAKEGNDYYFGDGLYVFYEGGLERAGFEISKLIISPAKVKVGKPVTVKFDVENVGNVKDAKTVNIEINGEIVGSKEVTLAPGEIVTLEFSQNQPEEGEYSVVVGGQTGDYAVVTPGFGVIFAIAGLLAVAYLFRRRKRE